jgi:hypothetical protein
MYSIISLTLIDSNLNEKYPKASHLNQSDFIRMRSLRPEYKDVCTGSVTSFDKY